MGRPRGPSVDRGAAARAECQPRGGRADGHAGGRKPRRPCAKMRRAVIVEPRRHPALGPIVDNVGRMTNLPVTIVHGTDNADLARSIAESTPQVERLIEINAANLDLVAYNNLWLAPAFWDAIGGPGDTILKFETDSGVCDSDDHRSIPGLASDYCGAPWVFPRSRRTSLPYAAYVVMCAGVLAACIACIVMVSRRRRGWVGGTAGALGVAVGCTVGMGIVKYGVNPGREIGNGGLSVRGWTTSRRHAQAWTDAGGCPTGKYCADDLVFAEACARDPECEVCSRREALAFSTEGVQSRAWGFHKNWGKDLPFKSLCPFNKWVRDHQSVPGARLPAPPPGWVPTFRETWRRPNK
jgi:hypothetical protein